MKISKLIELLTEIKEEHEDSDIIVREAGNLNIYEIVNVVVKIDHNIYHRDKKICISFLIKDSDSDSCD